MKAFHERQKLAVPSVANQSELAELRFGKEALESKLRKYAAHCQRLEEEKAEVIGVLRSSNALDGDDISRAVVSICDKLASLEQECESFSKSETKATSNFLELENIRTQNLSLRSKLDQLLRKEAELKEKLAARNRENLKATESTEMERDQEVRFLEQENLQLMTDLKASKKNLQKAKAELTILRLKQTNGDDRDLRSCSRRPRNKTDGVDSKIVHCQATTAEKENTSNHKSVFSSVPKARLGSTRKEPYIPGLGEHFPDSTENTQECKQS